jgi:hypothetical protein
MHVPCRLPKQARHLEPPVWGSHPGGKDLVPLLTPGFSPLKIQRVKSQHGHIWLAFRQLTQIEHLCEPMVGSHQRQVHDRCSGGFFLQR